jgi:hypothetical protein
VYSTEITTLNSPGKIFSGPQSIMGIFGTIASTLFSAGISGIPMLLSSPFWVIYIMANAIGGSGTFATY